MNRVPLLVRLNPVSGPTSSAAPHRSPNTGPSLVHPRLALPFQPEHPFFHLSYLASKLLSPGFDMRSLTPNPLQPSPLSSIPRQWLPDLPSRDVLRESLEAGVVARLFW